MSRPLFTDRIGEAMREIFDDESEVSEFAMSLVKQAKAGNATLAKEILLRVDGPPKERVEDEELTQDEVLARIAAVFEEARRRESRSIPAEIIRLFG